MIKKSIYLFLLVLPLFVVPDGCVTSSPGRKERIYSKEITYSNYLSFALMRDYVKFGDFEGALKVYGKFRGRKTNNIEFLAAYAMMKIGRYKEAAEKFLNLYRRSFLSDYSLYLAGLNYFKNGDFYVSRDLLEQHLKTFSSSIFSSEDRCILTKINNKLGLRKMYEGEFPDSADCLYTRILSVKDNRVLLQLVKKFILTYPGHPYENEILQITGSTIFSLLNIDQLKKRWEILIRKGKWSLLKREVRDYLKNSGDRGCYYYFMGKMRFRKKDYNAAVRYFVRARKMKKNGCAEDVLYNLGRSYARIDRNRDSIKVFKILLEKFPNTIFKEDTIYRLGLVYTYMKVTESALSTFERYHTHYPNGKYIEDVLWKLALFSYSSGNSEASFEYLKELYRKGSRLRKAQSLYWQARWNSKDRIHYLQQLMIHFSFSFYSYVASRCLNADTPVVMPRIKFYAEHVSEDLMNYSSSVTESLHLYNIKHLLELGLNRYVYAEAEKLVDIAKNKMLISYLLAKWLMERDLYYLTVKLIARYFPDEMLLISFDSPLYIDLTRFVFPEAYREIVEKWAEETNLSPEWLWAIMRQESRFNPMAVSVAGAVGLMQLMPYTAKKIAAKINFDFDRIDLFNPDINVMLASYYLKFLFDQFHDPILVAAAYNAGEDNVSKWKNQIDSTCIDEWVEQIPFDETRKYVKKVIENWMTYSFLKGMIFYETADIY